VLLDLPIAESAEMTEAETAVVGLDETMGLAGMMGLAAALQLPCGAGTSVTTVRAVAGLFLRTGTLRGRTGKGLLSRSSEAGRLRLGLRGRIRI